MEVRLMNTIDASASNEVVFLVLSWMTSMIPNGVIADTVALDDREKY